MSQLVITATTKFNFWHFLIISNVLYFYFVAVMFNCDTPNVPFMFSCCNSNSILFPLLYFVNIINKFLLHVTIFKIIFLVPVVNSCNEKCFLLFSIISISDFIVEVINSCDHKFNFCRIRIQTNVI